MKKCPYCGNEYPDDATACFIDGEPLADNTSQLTVVEDQAVDVTPHKDDPPRTFPDYQWAARDAWKCVAMILLLGFVFETIIYALGLHFLGFRRWHGAGFGYFSIALLRYAVGLLVAVYFARTDTFVSFWKGFSLDLKPSDYVWFGIVMALIIRFSGHFLMTHGWGKGVNNYGFTSFRHAFGFERYFFLISPLILAPILEESINRGFLYKAFRGSYSITLSTILIVAWTAITHWGYYSHSWIAALDLSALTLVQCYLREKSDSLWDCIFCHFAFNASSLLFIITSLS